MLSEIRWNEIIKIVNQKKSVSVQELTESLDASESTIRRDLSVLDKKGLLKKVHGGATSFEMGYSATDDVVAIRENLYREEKLIIARYAASLIGADDFVFLDAGTTTERMIDCLEVKGTVFVTNATVHAQKLAVKGYRVFLLGGEFKASTEAVVGIETVSGMNKYHFTKCFVGANGVSPELGFSTPDVNEAMVKEKALQQSREKYVLCDASKFHQISPVKFGEFSKATVITSKLEEKKLKNYENIVEVINL